MERARTVARRRRHTAFASCQGKPWAGAGAGGPTAFPGHVSRREPGDGRILEAGPQARETEPGTRIYSLPAPERTPPAEVFHPFRRRAADAGHGPRLDAGAGGADDRRALARSGPGAGATTLPDLRPPAETRAHHRPGG